jgi:photosystem II stability/assembly factor-like uncharacterized protein
VAWLVAVLALGSVGCHHYVPEDIPSADTRKITIADRFYDVVALDEKQALVVGYAGKILRTDDGGYTWSLVSSGTDRALYSISFPDKTNGWIVGQDGLILHSSDAGKTWSRQKTNVPVYLFAVHFTDANNGWAVGDKATYVHTSDGGQTWIGGKIAGDEKLTADEALLAQEPVLYGVRFLDPKTGWIVGEFGNIYHTTDGGASWRTQQESLIGAEGTFDALDIPTFFGVSFADANTGVTAGLETKLAKTTDGGAVWKFDETVIKDSTGDPLYQPFLFSDATGWAVGAAGTVVERATPDAPWQRVALGMEVNTWLRGVYFRDKNDGWVVGGYGLILHTTDGGKTWLPSLG